MQGHLVSLSSAEDVQLIMSCLLENSKVIIDLVTMRKRSSEVVRLLKVPLSLNVHTKMTLQVSQLCSIQRSAYMSIKRFQIGKMCRQDRIMPQRMYQVLLEYIIDECLLHAVCWLLVIGLGPDHRVLTT